MEIEGQIKVFISYSHDSDEHKEFVRVLADKLRSDGINCKIDQYEFSPSYGWTDWMHKMFDWANFVLVIFTPLHAKSWRGESENEGATYEAKYIKKDISAKLGKNEKYIPVIPEKGDRNDVQFPLSDSTICTLMKDYDHLYKALTGQSPLNPPVTPKDPDKTNDAPPYCGLQSFKEEDEKYFYGRDAFINDRLIPAIENKSLHFISLFGASGVGKSSVVSAGLIPRLKRGNWKCEVFEPDNDPFYSLARTLIKLNNPESQDNDSNEVNELVEDLKKEEWQRKQFLLGNLASIEKKLSQENKNLLIVIDRFEDIYKEDPAIKNINLQSNQEKSENQGFKFLRCLLSDIKWPKEKLHPNRIVLLAVTTSDGHNKTTDRLKFEGLYDPSAHYQLTGLTREEMRQAIENPAKDKGVQFEEGLVDIMLEDAGLAPGMLPLLEVTLKQLWNSRAGNLIKTATYMRMGGIRGALTNYADGRIADLESDLRHLEIAKDIFLQLIDAREDLVSTEKISSRAVLKEVLIAKETERKTVLDYLVKERLLIESKDSTQIRIPHDLMIKYWPQINVWLNQDTRNRIFINDLKKERKSGKKMDIKLAVLILVQCWNLQKNSLIEI